MDSLVCFEKSNNNVEILINTSNMVNAISHLYFKIKFQV